MLDVVEAVDGDGRTFVCTEMRQRGPLAAEPAACTAPCPIARVMWNADRAWRDALRAVTIADVAADVAATSGPEAVPMAAAWIAGG